MNGKWDSHNLLVTVAQLRLLRDIYRNHVPVKVRDLSCVNLIQSYKSPVSVSNKPLRDVTPPAGALLSTQSSVFKCCKGTDLRQSGYGIPCTGEKGRCILYKIDYLPRCLDLYIALYMQNICILYAICHHTFPLPPGEFAEEAKHQTTNIKKNISL